MKHFFKFLIGCVVGVACVEALPQGNPTEPNGMEEGLFFCKENFFALKGGYIGDVSWNASYKTEDVMKTAEKSRDRPNQFKSTHSLCKSYLHLGTLAINILNQVEGYGFMGTMQGRFSHVPLSDHNKRKYKTPYHPAYGGGVRLIGFYWKRATLGFDGKYLFANLPIRSVRFRNRSVALDGMWEVRRWQVAGALSYQIDYFVPYLGARYSAIDDKIRKVRKAELTFDGFKIKNRRRFGGTAGVGFFPGDDYSINVEWRFYDEEAFSASFTLKF